MTDYGKRALDVLNDAGCYGTLPEAIRILAHGLDALERERGETRCQSCGTAVRLQCDCGDTTAPTPPPAEATKTLGSAEAWMETARQHCKNEEYYRGLLVLIGETMGAKAYTSDDGSIQQDVICAKLPALVEALQREHDKLRKAADVARQHLVRGNYQDAHDALSRALQPKEPTDAGD